MRTTWNRISAFIFAAGLAAALPAVAERTRFWKQSNFDEFEKGTAKGVALRSDGKLVLAPRFAQFADPNAAFLWALRMDSKGNLHAAGGTNAKVFRFDAQGKATVVFESAEMAAQALAIDALDNLYVGTSPDGKVYRLTPGGERRVFFEPKTKYIWDLAVDAAGNVYVATGDKGEVFAVTPDGKGRVYYKSEETHARALAFDKNGNLLMGTEPSGLILRVEKIPAGSSDAPRAFVLYETNKKEVTALAVDAAGNIYASAIGEKPKLTPQAIQAQQAAQQAATQIAQQAAAISGAAQPMPFVPFPQTGGGSEVYRIGADGAPEEVWSSREDLVYTLGLGPSGKLLLGTGNRGLVVQLEGSRVFSALAKTASSQVTSLVAGPGGKVYLCTANPGKVFTLGPGEEPEGTFESQAFDARIFSQWGRLTWWGENGSTLGQVSFYARSGNTSSPEKNWSAWAGPYTNAKGEIVSIPPARFAQWKAVFRAAGGAPADAASSAPGISWASLAYLPKNQAPTIDGIVVQNSGVRVQGMASPQPGGASQPVQLRMPPSQAAPGMTPPQPQNPPKFDVPPQGFAQRGAQSVVWTARDENDDDLEFTVYYRGEGETTWKLLAEKLDQKFYSWDGGTMPDGAYSLKVAGTDANSNPPGEGLTAVRESDRFEVDNTPPLVEGLKAEPSSPEWRVRFTARDSYSPIARVEYSLDAKAWKLLFPTDRTTDSPMETYDVVLRDVAPGEHTVAVRAFDQFENSTSAKVTFTVEPPKKR